MKIHRIDPTPAELPPDPHPSELATHLVKFLFGKSDGAFFGKWDQAAGVGTWFYSRDTLAVFELPQVEEAVYRETNRSRFRSVVFRLGSLAAEQEGDLCGVMQLFPAEGHADPGPAGRRYVVHASFYPQAGLWFRAAIIAPPPELLAKAH